MVLALPGRCAGGGRLNALRPGASAPAPPHVCEAPKHVKNTSRTHHRQLYCSVRVETPSYYRTSYANGNIQYLQKNPSTLAQYVLQGDFTPTIRIPIRWMMVNQEPAEQRVRRCLLSGRDYRTYITRRDVLSFAHIALRTCRIVHFLRQLEFPRMDDGASW